MYNTVSEAKRAFRNYQPFDSSKIPDKRELYNRSHLDKILSGPVFIEGQWYKHIASGSYAYYKGLEVSSAKIRDTLGINPTSVIGLPYINTRDRWFGEKERVGKDWIECGSQDATFLFKAYFSKLGYTSGAKVYFMGGYYTITNDWYIDKETVYMIGKTDSGYETYIALIDNGIFCKVTIM